MAAASDKLPTITESTTRIPAVLWDALQHMCYRQDAKFIEDAAKIIGVPAADIKKKVLGVRGCPTAIITQSGPWWETKQCPAMVHITDAGIWHRCTSACETDTGVCWEHKVTTRKIWKYDDPVFKTMIRRKPVDYGGETVWVAEDGSVMTHDGIILKNITIDTTNGLVTEYDAYSGPILKMDDKDTSDES